MDEAIVSIIIVNYNAGAYPGQCLWSIAELSLKPCEVIVVNNASSEGSLAQAGEVPNAIAVRNTCNPGLAAAQNQVVSTEQTWEGLRNVGSFGFHGDSQL